MTPTATQHNRWQTSRRVEFGDTDMAGIVHFSRFFLWMEAAETEYLRSRGLSVHWVSEGVTQGFPRVSVSCDYKAAAHFEDILDIAIALERIGTKSITWEFVFTRGESPIAVGKMTSVYCLNRGGKMESAEIPPELRAKLQAAGRGG